MWISFMIKLYNSLINIEFCKKIAENLFTHLIIYTLNWNREYYKINYSYLIPLFIFQRFATIILNVFESIYSKIFINGFAVTRVNYFQL